MLFKNWLETFIEEKNIDLSDTIDAQGPSGLNIIPIGCVIEYIESSPSEVQKNIKAAMVKIDFLNGNVIKYFEYIAVYMAR